MKFTDILPLIFSFPIYILKYSPLLFAMCYFIYFEYFLTPPSEMTLACPDTPHIHLYNYYPPTSYFYITQMSSSLSPIFIDIFSAPLTMRLPCYALA